MIVKFNDLAMQFKSVESDVRKRMDCLFEISQYILGEDVKTFEDNFAKYVGCKYVIGVGSGTSALTLAANSLIDQSKKTLVIIQGNTYIATIFGILNSLYSANVDIRIIDCDIYGQLNLIRLTQTLSKLRNKYDECVIVPVHMYGGCVDVVKLKELQSRYDFKILEDSAQAHGTITQEYDTNKLKKKTGNIGDIAAFSFYPGKNLGGVGDGGAIATNSQILYENIIRTRNLGSVYKNLHSLPGFNSRLDTIQAIVLDEKLKKLDMWNDNRNNIAKLYYEMLDIDSLKPNYCSYHTYHLFPFYTTHTEKYLNNPSIQFGQHYPYTIVFHLKKWSHTKYANITMENLPNATRLTSHITLPMHPYMSDDEVKYVCQILNQK